MTAGPSPARTAAEIFVHYFRQMAERSGAQWTPQNTRDITDAVRALIEAVQQQGYQGEERDPLPPYRARPVTGATVKARRQDWGVENDSPDRTGS